MDRREFIRLSLIASTAVLTTSSSAFETSRPRDNQKVSSVLFPEKGDMIVYSDRPPLLETPRDVFTQAITPNNKFFVRWHMTNIPTPLNMDTYYLQVHGEVEKRVYLTLEKLKKEFKSHELTVALQCGGNSRSAFKPTTSGIQWGSGAMGCAKFKGVKLKDILNYAGLKESAKWITLKGNDKHVMSTMPHFKRELEIEKIADDVIVAYEMNGQDIPYLNGYPLRLIIPGVYADSWVKMLSDIYVTSEYKEYYYMDEAYRIPDNECECETPEKRVEKTKPLEMMNVKSYIGYPLNGAKIEQKSNITVEGIAFDKGSGIKEVLISLNKGKTWETTKLDKEINPYAFRVFRYNFKPMNKGKVTIMAKAVNNEGEEQPFAHEIGWNHGGYKYNGIDSVEIEVV